ncbi:MAG TPA: PQQ-dependent dehydrogenase, methanol/ethanol family [Steroidobacteraceae bacterium]|nr:PQQ-dependent dehydrogenase, methanol/ethanol family [Steroidobacteraceae bacterium]
MSHPSIKIGALLCTMICALAACTGKAPPPAPPEQKLGLVDDARLKNAAAEPQNWIAHGGTQLAQRYSGLDQVTADNVAQLKPAWSMDFDTMRGQESTPLVVDGVVYVTTAWSKVYAVNAKSGKQIWFYDPKVPGPAAAKNCCDVVNRGAAVYRGKVFVGSFDGRLIALDASTGKEVWSTVTTPPDAMRTITGAPRVGGGLVYIGNTGGEFGGRGYVSAYEADTGKLAWRFYTTPGDPAMPDGVASDDVMAAKVQATWSGKHNDYRGGGNVWNSIVYDTELDQLYIATGNGFPWMRTFRSEGKGDNLFIESVVALDAATGAYKWHYQETPGDIWDYDSIADMILADLTIGGQPRKVLMHTPKNGFFYNVDRRTGELISAEPYVPGVTWAARIDAKTGRPVVNPAAEYDRLKKPAVVSPGEGGGHSWQPTAFSPKTGYFYLQATAYTSARHLPRPKYEYVKGLDNIGTYHFAQHAPGEAVPSADPNARRPESYLLAWDPVAQKAAWKTPGSGAGVLATAGGLIFQGNSRNVVMGELNAYRADTGEKVWSHQTPNALMSGPVSYAVDGEQYILATSGAGGGSIIAASPDVRERQVGRLVAFKLNGTATLPADPPPARPLVAITETLAPAAIETGKDLYLNRCARCHGLGTRSANVVPDLRRSPALVDKELWRTIVEDGSMQATGMIAWKSFLPDGGAEAIRAYVADETRKLQQVQSGP